MTVRILQYEPDYDVVPQAIFWRPLRYFTLIVRDGEDGLDMFKGASFAIGNDIRFDLRVYRGHLNPEFTVTLYLPLEVTDEQVIAEVIERVMKEMVIPITDAAWKRGQPCECGKLELWQQIVRNVAASHPTIFDAGLARKVPGGIEVTDKGMVYLNSIGYLATSTSNLADVDRRAL